MRINAFAAYKKGEELKAFEYEPSGLKANECIVQIETCGICHSDIHMIDNDWMISKYPIVPGHEIVGKVLEAGKEVTHLKKGDRVGIGWESSACLVCPDCLRGNENLCSSQEATIIGRHGGFADHVKADSRFCFKIPDTMESAIASPLLCAGITVYSALRYAGMTSGLNVGVIGLGGLGHLAVQFASKLGNRVTVFTTSKDKEEFAVKNGASEVLVSSDKKKPERPLDIILNTVDSDLEWNNYINFLGSDGTMTFVGIPRGNLNFNAGLLLGKRKRVMASPIGGRAMISEMLDIADRFKVAPVIERFPKSQINEAIAKVRNNTIRYRAVVDF